MSNAAASVPVEQRAIRKVATRLVPFVALMFFINFLDRTAIGFAAPNGMEDDLALTATQFGFASGVFFIGYILLEVPSNIALHKVGARRWLARIMVTWGIVALLFTWVQSATQLYILRFLLGVAEAGFSLNSRLERGHIVIVPNRAEVPDVSPAADSYHQDGREQHQTAGYATGWLKERTGDYYVPMFIVGAEPLLGRQRRVHR